MPRSTVRRSSTFPRIRPKTPPSSFLIVPKSRAPGPARRLTAPRSLSHEQPFGNLDDHQVEALPAGEPAGLDLHAPTVWAETPSCARAGSRVSRAPSVTRSPGCIASCVALEPQRTRTEPPDAETSVTLASCRPVQESSETSKPPRVRRPLTEPSGQVEGSAGSSSISAAGFPSRATSSRLWTSISETPAVKAKLPSIWNGGWASNRFG